MISSLFKNKFTWAILSLSLVIFISSCGDDETTSNSSDQFIGTYQGSFACGGLLSTVANSDDLQFVISEGLTGENSLSIQLLDNPLAFPLDATADGNNITITNNDLGPFPFDTPLGTINSNIDANGNATLNGNTLSGTISVTIRDADNGTPLVTGEQCTITGVKQ